MTRPVTDSDLIDRVESNIARYKAITPEVAAFPYGTEGAATITWGMWVNALTAMDDLKEPDETIRYLDEITGGGFSRTTSIFGKSSKAEKITADFTRMIDELKRGAKSDIGETVELDRFGCPNIAPYMAGCREIVSVPIDKIDSIDLDTFIAPWHATVPASWPESDALGRKYTYKDDEGTEWVVGPYGLLWPWDMFRVIANLCAGGYEDSIRTAINRRRTDAKREAAAQGAIVSLDGYLTAYSSKEFWQAFMPNRIMRLPYTVNGKAFDEDGRLIELALGDNSLLSLTTLQENFLHAMATIVEKKILAGDYDEQTMTIYFHAGILDQMGIDPRTVSRKRDASDTRTMAQRRLDKLNNEILPPF